MIKKNVPRRDVQGFLEIKLKRMIKRDLRAMRIVSEADLQSEVHRHLKRYLNKDKRWKILNKPHFSKTRKNKKIINIYPDFVLTVRKPRIAIELKEKKYLNKKRIYGDAKKLNELGKQKSIRKGFVFYLYRKKMVTEEGDQRDVNALTRNFSPYVKCIIINAYEHVPSHKWNKWAQMWDKYSHYEIK